MKGRKKRQLERSMSPLDVWAMALGAIIGWGCFVMPGNAFLPKAGPAGMAWGMLIGGALILVIAFSYGYLLRKYPVSGGEFVYARIFFGKGHAFICGWAMVLAYWSLIPLNATALGLISRYLFPVLQFGKLYEVAGWPVYTGELLTAVVFIILVAVINIWGVKKAAWTQTAVALVLVGAIFLLAALVLAQNPDFKNLSPGFPADVPKFDAIFAIVAMAPWAFIGFDCIPQAAEEYNFKPKFGTLILIIAVIVAALLYTVVNTITAVVMPWQELLAAGESWPTGFVVGTCLGKIGLGILGVAMFCAVFSGMNAFYMATSRLIYAMAKEHALPVWLGHLNKKSSPNYAIIFIMILSLLAPWFGREVLGWIVDMTSLGASVVFAYTTATAFVLAKQKKQPMQMVVASLGFLFSLFFISLLVVPGMPGFLALPSWICLGVWVLMGAAFFMVIRKKYYAKKSDLDSNI